MDGLAFSVVGCLVLSLTLGCDPGDAGVDGGDSTGGADDGTTTTTTTTATTTATTTTGDSGIGDSTGMVGGGSDTGETSSGSSTSGGSGSSSSGSSGSESTGESSVCGNAMIEGDEDCDDGNVVDGDGCDADCTFPCMASEAIATGADRVYLKRSSCYHAHDFAELWADARDICQAAGRDLAVIDDQAENTYVWTLGYDLEIGEWIGYHDTAVEGAFEWVAGGTDFTNWLSGQPDDAVGGADCAVFDNFVPGLWADVSCNSVWAYVCETNFCGNGMLDFDETCDDGNQTPGDGCSAVCQLEPTCFDDMTACYDNIVTVSPAMILDGLYDGTVASMTCATISMPSIGNDAVEDVAVGFAAVHNRVGDLVIKLLSPSGTVTTLLSRPGYDEPADDGSGDEGNTGRLTGGAPILFSDAAVWDAETMGVAGPLHVCSEDGQCEFSPNAGAAAPGSLGDLVGEVVAGNWQLCFGDAVGDAIAGVATVTLYIDESNP